MTEKFIEHSGCRLRYFQKGEDPVWLIHTGTHGDERDVIGLVRDHLAECGDRLPDLIWVPEVSPSAVRAGTRDNEHGLNLNRVFFEDAVEPEARANLALIKEHSFRSFITIHEDLTTDKFYMYEHDDNAGKAALVKLFSDISSLGVGFYEGLDDDDPALCNLIRRGYFSCRWQEHPPTGPDGTFEGYMGFHRASGGKIITAEVPGLLPAAKREAIVALLFAYLSDERR